MAFDGPMRYWKLKKKGIILCAIFLEVQQIHFLLVFNFIFSNLHCSSPNLCETVLSVLVREMDLEKKKCSGTKYEFCFPILLDNGLKGRV